MSLLNNQPTQNLNIESLLIPSGGAERRRRSGVVSLIVGMILFAVGTTCFAQAPTEPTALERIYGPYAYIVRQIAGLLFDLGVVILVALPFQYFFPAIKREPKIKSYEYWLDIIFNLQGVWLSLVSFFVAVNWLTEALYGNQYWLPQLQLLPSWVQVLIAVWAFDFAVYWRHRLEHEWPLFWSFHAVHHTAEQVDVLTTSRLHPFELALSALINASVIRLGLDPAATALGFAIYLKYNYFVHSNVRVRYPGFLKYIFISPFMHHWHHAKDAEAAGKNVGVIFAWNDWLFGTYYHPDHWPTTCGLSSPKPEQVGQSYLRQLLYPFQYLHARMQVWREARQAG